MNNLSQVGRATAMYLGDYGGYLPGGLDWSSPNNVGDKMVYVSGSEYVHASLSANERENGVRLMRTIGAGAFDTYDTTRWDFVTDSRYGSAKQSLKVAPWGLGLLLTSNYLADAQCYYCPSASGVTGVCWSAMYNNPVWLNDCLNDWKTAGGIAGRTLTHGDWPRHYFNWQNQGGSNHGPAQFTVVCQYDYRSQPIVGVGAGPSSVRYVKPALTSGTLTPAFKTIKLLGDRALVSDAFDKLFRPNASYLTKPGFSFYAHKDGYQVLYGDGSTGWYGDAAQEIMWTTGNRATGSYFEEAGYAANILTDTAWVYNAAAPVANLQGGLLVFHLFDLARGIDAN